MKIKIKLPFKGNRVHGESNPNNTESRLPSTGGSYGQGHSGRDDNTWVLEVLAIEYVEQGLGPDCNVEFRYYHQNSATTIQKLTTDENTTTV